MNCLDAALQYAELGYRVFPCVPNGKPPATKHGCLDATTDEAQIQAWWAENPAYNVAVATDGLLVLDIDPDGKPWLTKVDTSELMRATMTSTPRGGVHFWFRADQEFRNTSGDLAKGVDTRANGGYVLVPPSVVDGKPYRWVIDLEAVLPSVPAWLVAMLGGQRPKIRESVSEEIPEGNRNHAMIRFAGLFRRGGMSEGEIFDALAAVNSSRCKPPLRDKELRNIARSAARYEPDFIEESLILSHLHNVPDEPVEEEAEAVFPQDCLQDLPGPMRDAFRYAVDTSIKPQPELSLAALIALFGAAFGQKVCDDYDTRTNVMVLGLAPSGSGKEYPRQVNKRFLLESGLELVNGPERIGSHAGIISAVSQHPIRLFQLDEIGRLLATMRDPKVSHLYNVGTVLMALYSSSNTIWTGDAYADATKVKRINQPHVCVYGTSVAENLYSGLSPENLTDGLVGRLLIFQSDVRCPQRRKPLKAKVPKTVLERLRMWAEWNPPGSGNLGSPSPILAEKTPEADTRHESYCDLVNDKHQRESEIHSAVWSRAPEKAAKLALIYACCAAKDMSPVVTIEAENWGIRLANYSTRLVLQAARNTVAGSKYESDLKRVFCAIRDGCTQNELTRRTQWLKRKERQEILADLEASGAIKSVEERTEKRTRTIVKRMRCSL